MRDPLEPPTSTMESCNAPGADRTAQVFSFGDQTIAFEPILHNLLHVKGQGTLTDFFDSVGAQLRSCIGSLPSYQQEWFPLFTTLVDLFAEHDQLYGSPALKFTLLAVTELAQFIRYVGQGSKPYPSPSNTYLVGACTGSFAAAAVSTSQTLAELVPVAVETVIIAFQTALRALVLRSDLASPLAGESKSWSAILGAEEEDAVRLVTSFNTERNFVPISKLYISSVSSTSVTVSGPSTTLAEFISSTSLKHAFLPIELPYHAPHLFLDSEVDELVQCSRKPLLIKYHQRFKILSAVNGEVLDSLDFYALIRRAVSEALRESLRWDVMTASLGRLLVNSSFTQCEICQVCSSSGAFLAASLTRQSSLKVNVTNIVEEASTPSQNEDNLFNPTGKFSNSNIAIIGYSGRFPDAASNEEFWDLLMAGRDVHRTIPPDRFDWEKHYDPTGRTKNTSRVKYGCFIKEPGVFDARFFNMSPRECENSDPAQRLAITTAYEAMEMAGLVPNSSPSTRQDRIGVFYGVTSDDWREVNSGQDIDTYFIPGGNRAFIPGRISYFFRFCGPSLSIDTACSSSFAAIQTACVYLWRGECDTAVAGGSNVLTNPDNFAGLDRGHFLSTTGNCNAFDDGASGYCRSDAVGSVVLKRLEDAIADNDPIFGVIRGAFTNHCGRTDSITRPFEGDQAAVFNRIMRYTGLSPLDVGYVEMHGTGTQAGDATEMKSVLSVFAPHQQRKYPLYLGTAKANIGHAESASGVASLIKVLLMMKNNAIPPHCGIKTKINRNYPKDLEQRNIHIPFQPAPWYSRDMARGKRSVFLNNFSAAGGNTAMLVEDAPVREPKKEVDPRPRHLITVTAKSIKALQGNIEALVRHLDAHRHDISVSALSFTTTARRIHHTYRVIVSGSDITSIRDRLQANLPNISDKKPIPTGAKTPNVIFVFTGQGTLYQEMGKSLFNSSPAFHQSILRLNRLVEQQGFPSFLSFITGGLLELDEISPVISHLALVCTQIALCEWWNTLGIKPAATIGHSLGEYAALYAAGVLNVSDVIYLVGTRAQLLAQNATRDTHGMLAIKGVRDVIERNLVGTACQIACLNQPASNVVSGPVTQLKLLQEKFNSLGVASTLLEIPYAFHSAQVDPILEPFQTAARGIHYRLPSIPYISPLLGKVITKEGTDLLDADYLVKACRQPVDFQGALQSFHTDPLGQRPCLWLEIGAHPTCSGMIKGTLGSDSITIASLRKNTDPWTTLTAGLETLYSSGLDIQWTEYHRGFENYQDVLALPRYSWDLKNYWIQYRHNFCLTKGDEPLPAADPAVATPPAKQLPYLSPSIQRILEHESGPDVSTLLAESDIHDPRLSPILEGHAVNGAFLCPSSLYADIGLTVAKYMIDATSGPEAVETSGLDVANMNVQAPLVSKSELSSQLYHVSATADWRIHTISIKLWSVDDGRRKISDHASFVVRITPNQNWITEWKRNAYLIRSRIRSLHESVQTGDAHKIKRSLAYHLFATLVDYGSQYQGMQEVALDADQHEATARVSFQTDANGFVFNPCWVDSLGHIAGFIMNASDFTPSKSQVFINHGWDRMRLAVPFKIGKQYQVYNRMQLESGTTYAGDTYIFDGEDLVAIFEGVRFQGVPRRILDRLLPPRNIAISKAAERPAIPTKTAPRPQQPARTLPTPSPGHPKSSTATLPPDRSKKGASSLASRVMAIVAKEAGVEVSELLPNEEFANHGIDSLLSLTICGRIQEELGADVPSSLFVDCPTPKDLMAFFSANEEPSMSSSSSDISSGAETPGNSCDTDGTSDSETEPSVLAIVRETISAETGVPLEEVTPTVSFADLGVDSLLALTIVGKLTETLGLDLPSSLFMQHQNLEEVGKELGITVQPERVRSIAPSPTTFDPHIGPPATSILLWGNPTTARKILFLFPDGSGSATSYASLPKLGADTAAYGLNCPWMKTPHDMTCTLEELTAKYVVEIRRRQPTGPYYLGGWSAGGICAYEAAQQLARAGSRTERLILIDSPNPIGLENPPQRMYDFFESLGIFGSPGKAPPSWLRPHFDAFIRLLDNYNIRPLPAQQLANTYLVYARDGICNGPDVPRPELRPDDPREMLWLINNRTDFSGDGWASLVGRAQLHISVLSGVNHFSMMDSGPHMEQFKDFLQKALA